MNKTNLCLMSLAMVFFTTSACAENRALEISINGIGPAVDAAAFKTVQDVIGRAVANGVIDKFIVKGYAIEGGFFACVQASPGTKAFGSFVRQLRSIVPNPETTGYSLHQVAACTDNVAICTQEAKQCPDGTYVSRVGPSCEFAPCPGN